jgi:guanylate kinase
MMPRGNLFVISGPAGVGKTTLINRAEREIRNLWFSISATTREPRVFEKEGVHYFFLAREGFEAAVREKRFLEWAEVHGEYYGTPLDPIDKHLDAGEDVIMDIDTQGALQVEKICPDAKLIFIMPPSLDDLHNRIKKRGTESEEDLHLRFSMAEKEMAQRHQYHHVIINDILEEAYRELAGIIQDIRNHDK